MPNAANHNPDPSYLRSLLDRAGVTQSQAAELLGVSPRTDALLLGPKKGARSIAPRLTWSNSVWNAWPGRASPRKPSRSTVSNGPVDPSA